MSIINNFIQSETINGTWRSLQTITLLKTPPRQWTRNGQLETRRVSVRRGSATGHWEQACRPHEYLGNLGTYKPWSCLT